MAEKNLKEKLKKISECTWEIPKEGNMRVPARIFLSEKLLEQVEEGAIQQVMNVAHLPGIFKHSLAMPDMHFGYGFPIGGVAALDFKEGGLSPGGIGFDINCLSPDSEILTRDGYRIKIKDIPKYINKIELVTRDKDIDYKNVLFVAERKQNGKVYKIVTNLGRELIASVDHLIFCVNKLKKVEELKIGDKVIINPFTGVEYQECDDLILDISDFEGCDIQIIKKLKENKLLPLKLSNEKIGAIARLVGYILGDGCIYKIKENGRERLLTSINGSKEDLENIRKDILLLGFKPSKIYSRKRVIKGINYYGSFVTINEESYIRVTSKAFAIFMNKLGIPIGRKTSCNFYVPEWIKKSPLWIKRNFLAAFFGAEMTKPNVMKKHLYNFIQPSLTVNKNKELKINGYEFLIEIAKLLKEFGVEINKIYEIPGTDKTVGIRLVISNKLESLKNLYTKIGFEYNRKRQILGQLVSHYLMLKEAKIKQREYAIEIINNLRKEMPKSKIIAISEDLRVNKRFVERILYEGQENVRIGEDFFSFEEYLKEVKENVGFSGFVFEEVAKIEEIDFDGMLYDIGVDKNHNFIANGFLVHNCGVRVLRTNLSLNEVKPKLKQLLESIFYNVPSGVGKGGKLKLSRSQLDDVLEEGAKYCVKNGYGNENDLKHAEENGCLKYANHNKVSEKAKSRGLPQLGTLGAGNHFLEIQRVDKIFIPEIAKIFGIEKENQICVMIHTGSRGLGHQICTDYLQILERRFDKEIKSLPDRELVYAPAGTQECEDYFQAMCAGANYAWANRQFITHWVRESFVKIMNMKESDIGLELIYDVAHNIAKIENHEGKKVYVHRKGATRAFPPGSEEIPEDYKKVGQPVLIPGSMGTASYILIGAETAKETFYSTAHGAGRVSSRTSMLKNVDGREVAKELEKKGILSKAASWRVMAEEAPDAYKDVDEVVKTTEKAGISKIVVRLVPIGVVKG